MVGDNTLIFSDANFDQDVLKSDLPVLVDFWADWCPPCRQVAPIVDAIAADNLGKVRVGKLNVTDNAAAMTAYNVRSIPTLLLFKGGQVVDKHVGAMGKTELQKMLDAHSNASA